MSTPRTFDAVDAIISPVTSRGPVICTASTVNAQSRARAREQTYGYELSAMLVVEAFVALPNQDVGRELCDIAESDWRE